MPAAITPRRIPQQERSRRQLQRLLDAAEAVLARDGAAALATTRIAAEAGVSVGTLYQYFPDKEAIAEALALRYWDEFAERVERLEATAEPVAAVLATLAGGFRERPGFRALWFGGLRTERVREATRPTRTRVAAAIEGLLPDGPDRPQVARMLVLAGDGLLREAFRVDPNGDPAVLEEARTMLEAYIDRRLP